MKNSFEGQQEQNNIIDHDYEAIAELDKRVQELDPLSLDSFLENSLHIANKTGNVQGIVDVVNFLDLTPSTLARFSLEESLAAVRDLNMIFSSLRRHNYDFKQNNKIEQALILLANRTNEVPTDTVFSYGTRNPQGPRIRTFTSLPEEKLFIGSFKEGMVKLPIAIKALEGLTNLRIDDARFGENIKLAQGAFEEMVTAIVKVRKTITPELFTNELRPYFEPKSVDGKTYQAPGGAQMPIVLIDQLLWGSSVDEEMYKHYFNENMQYLPVFLRKKADMFSQIKPIVDRINEDLKNLSVYNTAALAIVQQSLTSILSLLLFIEKFRIPHMKIAEENIRIRPKGSVGSGGYDTVILKFLLDHTTESKRLIISNLSKIEVKKHMKIYLITKNPGKLLAANSVFLKYNIELSPVEEDYQEIQAETSMEIARYTALEAAKKLNALAIREDHSLFINALNFPGPYTSYFEKKISSSMLLKLLENFNDRDGYFEVATVLAKPDGTFKEYIYQVPITISKEERGDLQKGWGRILMLKNDTRTFAEYPEQDRATVWDKNYKEVLSYIEKNL